MIASEILILATGLIAFSTTMAGSTACAYFCSRNGRTNIAVLKDKTHTLEMLVNELKQKLVALTRLAVITPDPSPWIEKAENFLTRLNVTNLEERVNAKCINGLLPNCYVQRGARMSIEEKFPEMDGLTEEGQRIIQALTVRGFKQLYEVSIVGNSRTETNKQIWRLVSMDNEPGTIFIHGTFGVGKTAIAKFVHNKALKESRHFDYVIWVTVVDGAGLWQVQEDIARSLKIDIPGSGDTVERARKLNDALLQKKNFLLVLDSMWQALSLQEIGIPEPVDGHRWKLIVTSRIRTVCKKIRSKKVVELKPLPADEAWDLFNCEIGSNLSVVHAETLESTMSVVAELDGLPYAINKLAQTLNEIQEENSDAFNKEWMRELAEWATTPVNQEPRDQEPFDRFKRSYENLNERTRSCFLFCALYPKNHLIEIKELIEYWMWEGLLGNIETLEESMRQGQDTLTELKNAHLLESVTREESEDKVKMLNLVHSMAINTMVKDGNRAFIRSRCSLTDLPSGHEWPSEVEKASFMKNQISKLRLNYETKCNRLSTLLLQCNPLNMGYDEHFFHNMRDLKVLDLSRTRISSLPKSLSILKKLRALLLRSCPELRKLPNLSKLRDLIVLDLSGTLLDNFPDGIQSMTKLRRLDLSQAGFGTFPASVVNRLIQLEELLMISDDKGGYVWGSKELDEKWEGACIEELVELGKLVVLQLNFLNAKVFDKYVQMTAKVPQRFRFCVGEIQSGRYAGKNSVTISGGHRGTPELWTGSLAELNVTSLLMLRNLTVLDVSNFSGHRLFIVETVGYLTKLRELLVRNCVEMEVVLQPAGEGIIFLPELTKLVLFDLPRLKSVCCGEVLSCPNLRSVEVWRCDNLKLPMIYSESWRRENLNLPMEIQVRGERNWLNNLEWDNPGNNSDPLFQVRPQLNSNFKCVEATAPPEFTTTSRLQRRMLQEGGCSSNYRLADVLQAKVDIRGLGVYCLLFACGASFQAQTSWIINGNSTTKGAGLLFKVGAALPLMTSIFILWFVKYPKPPPA